MSADPTINSIRPAPRHPRAARWLRWLTAAHLIGAAGLWFLIWEVSETHWLGSVATFLPRLPWMIPGVLLLVASGMYRSKAFWINLALLLFVLSAIGEFNIPRQAVT